MGGIISIFMLIAFILTASLLVDNSSGRIHGVKEQPFTNKWANKLYSLSFAVPFIWFIDEKETNKKTEKVKKDLFYANMSGLFNYRSFTVFRLLVVVGSVLIFLIGSVVINHLDVFASVLFNIKNIDMVNSASTSDSKIILLVICAIMSLLPTMVLSNKASYYKFSQVRDLPIIQLFIILMLRSKRPLNEILYALSKLKSKYKEAFNIGYRIYLRDKKEGLDFLENKFEGTKFKDTITVLRGLEEYSKGETIKLLENNMKEIKTENENLQKKKDVKKVLMSQMTLVLPFISIILLAFAPIVIYGISIFQQSSTAF